MTIQTIANPPGPADFARDSLNIAAREAWTNDDVNPTVTLPSGKTISTFKTILTGIQTAAVAGVNAEATRAMVAEAANGLAISQNSTAIAAETTRAQTAESANATAIATEVTNRQAAVATRAANGANSDITSITGLTTALALTQGGTGGNTAPTARTSLGLGTIATQAASAVALTGGAIDGVGIGATTPAAIKATTLSTSGLASLNTLTTTGSTQLGSGTSGVVIRTQVGATNAAIYNASVTASQTNYSLLSNATLSILNGTTGARLSINDVAILNVTSTGAQVGSGNLKVPTFTVATLPSASAAGAGAYVDCSNSLNGTQTTGNGTGGWLRSNGTNWLNYAGTTATA